MCVPGKGDSVKLLLFSDSHGNVANMADAIRLERPDRVLHMGDLARDAEELAAWREEFGLASSEE